MLRGCWIHHCGPPSLIKISNRISYNRRAVDLRRCLPKNNQWNNPLTKNNNTIFFPLTFRQPYATNQSKVSAHWTADEKAVRIPAPISRLDQLCQTNDPKNHEAVNQLLKQISEFGGFLNQVMFGKVMKYYSRIGALNDMENAFQTILNMKNNSKAKTEPNLVVVNEVMNAFAKRGQLDKITHYLDQLPTWKLTPDVVTYTIVINYYLKAKQISKALEYLDIMKKAGVKPNTVTYNAFIKAYLQANQPDKAVEILHQMEQNRVTADLFTFNLFVEGFSSIGDIKNMLAFFDLTIKLGYKPDVITFTSMLNGLYNNTNTTAELDKLLEKMKELGVKPDAQFCNLLISAYGRFNQKERLVQLLKSMEHDKITMDQTSLESAMAKLARVGVLEQAESYFHKICASFTPTLVCCNVRLDVLGKLGKINEMLMFFVEISQKYGYKPDTITYTTMLSAIIKKNLTQGVQFFEDHKSVMNPNSYSYNVLMDSLSETDPQLMFKYYHEMKAAGIKPTLATYAPIFKALRQHMDIDNIYKYLHLLRMEGLKPSLLIYTIILDAVAKQGDSVRTKKLLEEMEHEGIKPDATAYATVISSMYKSPQMNQLNEFLQRLRADGVKPTTELYNSVLSAATHSEAIRNEPQNIIRIRDVMTSQGIKPDLVTYNILLAYFGQMRHDLKNALIYYRQIYLSGFQPDTVTVNSLTGVIKASLKRPWSCKPWKPTTSSDYEEQTMKTVSRLLDEYTSSSHENKETQLRQSLLQEMSALNRKQHHNVLLLYNGILAAVQKNIVPARIIDTSVMCSVINAAIQICQHPLIVVKSAQKLGIQMDEEVYVRLMQVTKFDNFNIIQQVFQYIQSECNGKVPQKVLGALFEYYKDNCDLTTLSNLLQELEKDPAFEHPPQAFGALAACSLRMVQHYKRTGTTQNSFNVEQVVGVQNLVKSTFMRINGENLAFDIDAANEFIYFFIISNDLACVELVLRQLAKRQVHFDVVTINMLLQIGSSQRSDIRMHEFGNPTNWEWNRLVFDLSINTSNNKEANDIITHMQAMLGRQ